ncbi:MAG: 2-hydroxyacid dehydrogenase [Candidatus ainarchaeum sp.]|nr:2-hydroxyacid dehydrogenase [Candidatus ainarchaeum sp.]
MKFEKIVLYDLKSKPLEKEFIKKLKEFASSVKVVFAEAEYSRRLKPADLIDADAFVTRIFDYYDNSLFENKKIKYIGAMHTDISHFDKDFLNKKRITLTNVPDYATEAVAELTISALLNISRQTYDAMNLVKSGHWGFEGFLGWELKGKTLGIIGLGKIGSRVAEIAKSFGMNTGYYSKSKGDLPYKFLELNDLLKQSDVVSLHCPLTDETRNILNKTNLKLLKQNAVLLNSARMELVNLEALYELCQQKKIFVWFDELQDKKWREKFRKLDNVYLTPDYGWMTREAQERVREIALNNIKFYLEEYARANRT